MKIIDCLCGVGPWMHRDRALPYRHEDTVELMDHFGIDAALVHSNFSSGSGCSLRGNEMVAEICATDERFLPMFSVSVFPEDSETTPTAAEQLSTVIAKGGRSLWMLPIPGTDVVPWMFEELLQPCADRNIPVFVPAELFPPAQLSNLLDAFPGLRLVITGADYGSPPWLYPLLRRYEAVYACIGHFLIPPGMPKVFTDQFSADRLLFGSGLPFFTPGGLISCIMYADIPDADKEKILSGNLMRLLAEVER